MRPWTRVSCLVALAFDTPRAQQPKLRTATTSVLFDVVVRDARGKPIESLSLIDFEWQEDWTRRRAVERVTKNWK